MNPGDVFTMRVIRKVAEVGEQIGPHRVPGNWKGHLWVVEFDQMRGRPFVISDDEYPMVPMEAKRG